MAVRFVRRAGAPWRSAMAFQGARCPYSVGAILLCADLDSARMDAVSRSLLWGMGADAGAPQLAVHRTTTDAAPVLRTKGRPPQSRLRLDA